MLQRMEIDNLTVFPHAKLDFSSGLNIFIGENGCGKSHLLKAAYSIIAASVEPAQNQANGTYVPPSKTILQRDYAQKLTNVFRAESLGRLVQRKQGRNRCHLKYEFDDENLNCNFNFATSSKSEVKIDDLNKAWQPRLPVFFPTRELLTLYPNFISVYDNHYLQFDETYRDMCGLLGAPALKGARAEKTRNLLQPLETAMGGRVVLDSNGRFYFESKSKGSGSIEIPLIAEGMRKLAMIAQLVANGSLLDKGYLFWDEPETNLNPKLIKLVAKIILHLCKMNIQVFIATHSFFLLRELEILSAKTEFHNVEQRYFSLAIQEDQSVNIEQAQTTDDLKTLILLDEEILQSDRYADL